MPERLPPTTDPAAGFPSIKAMRAVVIEAGSLFVRERPDPVPAKGELLVRVHAAGLNGADMLQRAGRYPAPPGVPADIPGLELAGVVAAAGPDVRRFYVGERVMAVVGGGAQAEMITLHESAAMAVPEAIGPHRGGRVPRGLHRRPRCPVHPVRVAPGRTPARERCRRRRRCRRRPARGRNGSDGRGERARRAAERCGRGARGDRHRSRRRVLAPVPTT